MNDKEYQRRKYELDSIIESSKKNIKIAYEHNNTDKNIFNKVENFHTKDIQDNEKKEYVNTTVRVKKDVNDFLTNICREYGISRSKLMSKLMYITEKIMRENPIEIGKIFMDINLLENKFLHILYEERNENTKK